MLSDKDIAALYHYWGYSIERGHGMPEGDSCMCFETLAEAEELFSNPEDMLIGTAVYKQVRTMV